jgi:hypothetical protein
MVNVDPTEDLQVLAPASAEGLDGYECCECGNTIYISPSEYQPFPRRCDQCGEWQWERAR